MSEDLLKPPTQRCDEPLPEQGKTASPPSASPSSPMPALPTPAPAAEPPDEAWSRLIAAASAAGVPIVRLAPEHAVRMAQRDVSPALIRRVEYGYPAASVPMGTLTFFPPLAELGAARRVPELFFVAEAWSGEHVFKRRLRASLSDMEEPEELSADELEYALLGAACDYLEAIGAKAATESDAGHRFWLPGAESALRRGTEGPRLFALFGPLMSWEDFRAELERRLMVGRLWALLGLAAAVLALSRSGGLSSRLLIAFGALGIVGGGLGVGPWMRATKRLRALLDARIGD